MPQEVWQGEVLTLTYVIRNQEPKLISDLKIETILPDGMGAEAIGERRRRLGPGEQYTFTNHVHLMESGIIHIPRIDVWFNMSDDRYFIHGGNATINVTSQSLGPRFQATHQALSFPSGNYTNIWTIRNSGSQEAAVWVRSHERLSLAPGETKKIQVLSRENMNGTPVQYAFAGMDFSFLPDQTEVKRMQYGGTNDMEKTKKAVPAKSDVAPEVKSRLLLWAILAGVALLVIGAIVTFLIIRKHHASENMDDYLTDSDKEPMPDVPKWESDE